MTNQKTEKQSPAEKLAWAAGNITMKYFQSDKVAMGKRLPTPSEMEDLQTALAAYRSAPKLPSPSYRLDRLLDAATSINAILCEHDDPETIVMRDELDGALADYYAEIGRTEEYHYDPEMLPSPERILEVIETVPTLDAAREIVSELRKAM